jgi:hypothetical protein
MVKSKEFKYVAVVFLFVAIFCLSVLYCVLILNCRIVEILCCVFVEFLIEALLKDCVAEFYC